ncbi:outer membrane lipoprotein chaperone LolA [Marinobacteraceae bacterium S3BR75-40.1]
MPISRYNWLIWICLAVLAIHANAASAEDSGKAAERELSKLLENYQTYQADFTQSLVDDTGAQIQQAKGSLKAKRPGLFYWRSEPPLEQVITADGKIVKVYDPDLLQLTLYPMDKKLSATPALLLSGNVDGLAEAYEVSEQEATPGAAFRLKPKNAESLFTSLTLHFEDGRLVEMRMHDSLDQRNTLRFSSIVINEPVDNATFDLEVPDDVDVISNLESQ